MEHSLHVPIKTTKEVFTKKIKQKNHFCSQYRIKKVLSYLKNN